MPTSAIAVGNCSGSWNELTVFRKLYWVDNKNDLMYVTELNGTSRKTLMKDMSNPRAVALHPTAG